MPILTIWLALEANPNTSVITISSMALWHYLPPHNWLQSMVIHPYRIRVARCADCCAAADCYGIRDRNLLKPSVTGKHSNSIAATIA